MSMIKISDNVPNSTIYSTRPKCFIVKCLNDVDMAYAAFAWLERNAKEGLKSKCRQTLKHKTIYILVLNVHPKDEPKARSVYKG